ncbi:MAG TPA: hypothetical protein OQH54_07435 [Nitrosopumilus sp.]|nr:hypothetical protein [Thermoproteota archaeon]HJJ23525.1 hypothetical protein [Nitrosopumilus sp.]
MKITEIEIDDSQTGYYWVQIYTSNKKEAISLKHQILDDQVIRERLENEIIQSRQITARSSTPMEITFQSFLTKKLESILGDHKFS